VTDHYDIHCEFEYADEGPAASESPAGLRRLAAQFPQSGQQKLATQARYAKRRGPRLTSGVHRRRRRA
jgi:hypothetical protein